MMYLKVSRQLLRATHLCFLVRKMITLVWVILLRWVQQEQELFLMVMILIQEKFLFVILFVSLYRHVHCGSSRQFNRFWFIPSEIVPHNWTFMDGWFYGNDDIINNIPCIKVCLESSWLETSTYNHSICDLFFLFIELVTSNMYF